MCTPHTPVTNPQNKTVLGRLGYTEPLYAKSKSNAYRGGELARFWYHVLIVWVCGSKVVQRHSHPVNVVISLQPSQTLSTAYCHNSSAQSLEWYSKTPLSQHSHLPVIHAKLWLLPTLP